MKKKMLFYCYFGLALFFWEGTATVHGDEISSLLSIKARLIDPLGHLRDWTTPGNFSEESSISLSHCNWTGVGCNSMGLVQSLDLSGMNLSGRVSSSLTNLTFLKRLDLSENEFVGGFPIGLGKASGLTYINVSSNNFVGFLPEDLGNITALEALDFRGGYFEGSIPTSFKNLKKLTFLGISGNNLTGNIPPELGQLESIETIILGYNELNGSIPQEFGNLSNLKYLDLAVGNLGGSIPAELGKLKRLTAVYLFQNMIEGKIPNEIGNVTSLVHLDLSFNQISGEIPSEVTYLKNLQLLNLMCNRLTGPIPHKLGELTQLHVLQLWKNSVTGPLPVNLGKNSPLQRLDVSSNSLSGELPVGLCDAGNLTKLILFNNSFSGPIPLGLANCSSLIRVRIQNNMISGRIPVGLGNLPNLQRLELARNNLSGEIPNDLTLSTSLSFVDVSWNNLQSSLPSKILSLGTLQTFLASHNNLGSMISDEFQDCPSLFMLDLSSNHFSGKIPWSIASCERLVNLNLRNNQFAGEIPMPFGTMPTLAILDLSSNLLVGRIPEDLGSSPALEMLNLSYNKLEGPVPNNLLLKAINPNDLAGNPGLCGGVLPPCSQISSKSSSSSRQSHILAAFIVATSVILLLGLSILIATCVYRRWYLCVNFLKDGFQKSNSSWPWRLIAFQSLNFTSNEILACVKESNVIGKGSTGIVYKAETHKSPNTVVAVKKMWRMECADVEAGQELFSEVNILGRLRHRNIVRLLGYLHNQKDVMILYEYMPNGSLGAALHGNRAGKLLVDWVSRYNIAYGVAHGLSYLHHDCHPPVIHRDVKSNNILLDENFAPAIADFGLARTMLCKNETVSMVAGSYGYIAPEYGYTLKIDEKSDIYSFGVVLLELVTGKMPLDPAFGESIDIVEWVRRKISGRVSEGALDVEIAGKCEHVQEEMILVLRIALLCTAKNPRDRPTMRDVVTMLGEAKPRRKSICQDHGEKPIFSNSPIIGFL